MAATTQSNEETGPSLMVQGNACITKLPEELQLRILSFFTPQELSGTVAKVCKQWWELSKDSSLWKSLTLVLRTDNQMQASRDILKRYPSLRRLEIEAVLEPDNWMLYSKLFPSNLIELGLTRCYLCPNDLEGVVNVCPEIEIIRMRDCVVNIERIRTITLLDNLHSITLCDCRLDFNDCVKTIARRCEKLKCLRLQETQCSSGSNEPVTDDAIYEVVEFHENTFQELELVHAELTDDSLKTLSLCPNLTVLMLNSTALLTDYSLESLTPLPNLRVLHLVGGLFTKDGLCSYFSRACISVLQEFKMQDLPIDNDILRELAEKACNIQLLEIHDCSELTSTGLEYIVNRCGRLRTLSLNSMPELTGEFLEYIPSQLPYLNKLKITNCPGIGHHYNQQLRTRMPTLKVILRK